MPKKGPEELQRFYQKVLKVFGEVKYPIHNFQELAKAMGGAHATVTWEGRKILVEKCRNLVLEQFFPISSQEELLSIAANLELQRPGNKLVPTHMGKQLERSHDMRPPGLQVGDRKVLEKLVEYKGSSLAKGLHPQKKG